MISGETQKPKSKWLFAMAMSQNRSPDTTRMVKKKNPAKVSTQTHSKHRQTSVSKVGASLLETPFQKNTKSESSIKTLSLIPENLTFTRNTATITSKLFPTLTKNFL
jgi:hypothetical protein